MKPNAYNTVPIPAVHVMDLIAEGRMKPEQVDDLGDILMGNIPLHRKDDEIIVYSIGGMPVEDVAWGTMVYRNALKKGIGHKAEALGCPADGINKTGGADMRIQEHPILGTYEKGQLVSFTFDGKTLEGYAGEPIAMALKNAGVMVHRYTRKEHKPRGIFCAIGRCTDCVMVVNGQPNVRTCITPLEEGMEIRTQYGVTAEQPGGAAK